MTTTPKQTATSARNAQLANVDRLIAELAASADALRTKTADAASNDWRYVGKGGDLEEIERHLAAAASWLAGIAS